MAYKISLVGLVDYDSSYFMHECRLYVEKHINLCKRSGRNSRKQGYKHNEQSFHFDSPFLKRPATVLIRQCTRKRYLC